MIKIVTEYEYFSMLKGPLYSSLSTTPLCQLLNLSCPSQRQEFWWYNRYTVYIKSCCIIVLDCLLESNFDITVTSLEKDAVFLFKDGIEIKNDNLITIIFSTL